MKIETRDFKKLLADLEGKKRPEIEAGEYVVSKELYGAVKAAIASEQPLLLTGEPGTGKTRLAAKLAHDLSEENNAFSDELLVFNTKTTSTAQDLFYTYDALRHFNDANIAKARDEKAPDAKPYINLEALGKAIAVTSSSDLAKEFIGHNGQTKNVVVLIDEIDKAPRDFTNDILNEIDKMEFVIKELQGVKKISIGEGHRIIVIITSNSEKNLPEPFLRRCAYYHIPFPDKSLLMKIVYMHFGDKFEVAQEAAVEYFRELREISIRKKPATAELISWLQILEVEGFFKNFRSFEELDNDQQKALEYSLSVLVKTNDDLKSIQEFIGLDEDNSIK